MVSPLAPGLAPWLSDLEITSHVTRPGALQDREGWPVYPFYAAEKVAVVLAHQHEGVLWPHAILTDLRRLTRAKGPDYWAGSNHGP